MVASFTEVESGKVIDRPQLSEALQLAKLTGLTLAIAKLDRCRIRTRRGAKWHVSNVRNRLARLRS